MKERTKINECWKCQNKEPAAGNAHIRCTNPDPEMTGYQHAIENGWFHYPSLFDPVWKEKDCANFKEVEEE